MLTLAHDIDGREGFFLKCFLKIIFMYTFNCMYMNLQQIMIQVNTNFITNQILLKFCKQIYTISMLLQSENQINAMNEFQYISKMVLGNNAYFFWN